MSKNIVECVHWDPEVDAAVQDSRKQNLFWVIIAASAVVFVLALSSLFFFWPDSEPAADPSGETTLSGQQDPSRPDEPVTQPQLSAEDDLNLTRGMTLYQQKNYGEAIAAFDLAAQSSPDSAAVYMYRGQCYFNLSDYNQAVVDFTQAWRNSPGSAQPLIMRGGSYFFLHWYGEAIQDLTDALAMDLPSDSAYSAYSYRARAYEAMGEYALAQADYTAAANLQ